MANPKFYNNNGPFLLDEIADAIDCNIELPKKLNDIDIKKKLITDIVSLSEANTDNLSFLDNKKYIGIFSKTKAGAVIIQQDMLSYAPDNVICLITKQPYLAYALAAEKFYPMQKLIPKIDKNSYIDDSAIIGDGCRIDAGASIAAGVKIGDGCHICANAVIDENCVIGANSVIGATSYISHCHIGKKANIHAGVRIGTRGFGFAIGTDKIVDVPHLGLVIIGDMVEIGANSTIDRGSSRDTVIGTATKIDNMVHIAHNVKIGNGCVLAGMTGIAGSAILENYVMTGAQSGIAGHLTVGMGAQIAAKSGVIKNVDAGAKLAGFPAVPIKQFFKQQITLQKITNSRNKKS